MKVVCQKGVAALVALCAMFTLPVHATTVLNIPVTAAQQLDPFGLNNCEWDEHSVNAKDGSPNYCEVAFPITLPAGTTIHQITVTSGALNNPLLPAPSISAHLATQGTDQFNNKTTLFSFAETSFPSWPWLMSTPLMSVGKNYPDSFVTQSNQSYSVLVDLQNATYLTGIWITYN